MQPEKKFDWRTIVIIILTAIVGGSGVGAAYWLGARQSKPETEAAGRPKPHQEQPPAPTPAATVKTDSPARRQTTPQPPPPTPEPTPEIDLRIKGNRDSLIYHLPKCPNYRDISPSNIVWFKTHDEARAAGYRMARNCP